MPNNDDQLQQQYQEILNKYASSLGPPNPELEVKPPEETVSASVPEPVIVSEPTIAAPELPPLELIPPVNVITTPIPESPIVVQSQTSDISGNPVPEIKSEPVTPPVIPTSDFSEDSIKPPVTPPIYFPPEPSVPAKSSNFFKYLFYLSIIIFIVVIMAVIYNFSTAQQTPTAQNDNSTPVVAEGSFCEFNDQKVAVGDSVPSEDSCNTCTCGSDLTMSCTEKACATAQPTTKPIGKVYKDQKYGYQFECPTTAKYVVEATSVNGNKIPYKQESCTDGDSVVTVSVYDNTVVHSFGDMQTKVSPDNKYIVTFEGDTDYVMSSFQFL